MNKLQLFENSEFGSIRTLEIDDSPWFVGKDIAEALGYERPTDAVRKRVDEEDRGVSKIETPSGMQEMVIINESGLYSLIFGSKLDSAKKFKHWVTSEVLPSIRRTGSYTMPNIPTDTMATANEAAKILAPIFDRAGMPAPFQALAMKQIYRKF